jgi:hypothetical protein
MTQTLKFSGFVDGGPERIRTSDTWFRKPLLYPLSYGAGKRAVFLGFFTMPGIRHCCRTGEPIAQNI